jgi:hypothetical protein
MTRHGLLIVLGILTSAGVAAARPAVRPPDPTDGQPPSAPAQLEVISGDDTVAQHVISRTDAIVACLDARRATFVRARIRLSWGRDRKVRSVGVSGGGASFSRCVGKALRGLMPETTVRAGSGRVVIALRAARVAPGPAPGPQPMPAPPAGDLHTCRIDTDCTLHFRTSACIASDPVAVNKLDPAKVRATYPVRRLECGMGGPQYDELRDSNENRYSAACERARCVLRDAGPQPTRQFRLAP